MVGIVIVFVAFSVVSKLKENIIYRGKFQKTFLIFFGILFATIIVFLKLNLWKIIGLIYLLNEGESLKSCVEISEIMSNPVSFTLGFAAEKLKNVVDVNVFTGLMDIANNLFGEIAKCEDLIDLIFAF